MRAQHEAQPAAAAIHHLSKARDGPAITLSGPLGMFAVFKANPACQRIARIKGVGPKTATAMVAAIGDGADFKNGRHLAAWLGLVPRQHSSGDKRITMGESKRGSEHLRSLLVHGARAVVRTAPNKHDRQNQWVNDLRERRGFNRATVAVANKTARIIWAVLRTGEPY